MVVKCPQCHSEIKAEGKIYNQVDYINPPAFFKLSIEPFFAIFNSSIQLRNSFFACSVCGLIWSKIDNQQLHRFIISKGLV